jgi:ribosomal-protein-alanine N-acetyltransferase
MSAILKDPLLRLRPMRAADVPEVMRVEQAAYDHPWTGGIFQDCLRVGYSCWVCERGARLVGHSVMSVAVGEAHVLNVCVDPDMQGRGLGRRLLERVLNVARERHADTAFLEVRVSNTRAIALYESVGFREIGTRRGYYPDHSGREDARIYAKSLI